MAITFPEESLLLGRIVEALRPEAVWLFGSRGRGEAAPGSDWDFLAILPDDAPDELLDAGRVWDLCLRDAPVPADVLSVRRADFEQLRTVAGALCRTVAEEGRRVYGN